ncbi:MAG: DUF6686 family protein [Mangrovibacterium sp.]
MDGRESEITINQTTNGRIYKCSECNKIHVDYKNLSFSFQPQQYQNIQKYIQQLDAAYWASQNEEANGQYRVMIPINHESLMLNFTPFEISELKELFVDRLDCPKRFRLLKTQNFDFKISNN